MGVFLERVVRFNRIAIVPLLEKHDAVLNLARRISPFMLALFLSALPCVASSLRVSAGSNSRLPTEVEADYTTSHVFINELANESVPFTIVFDPQTMGVASAEVFTNLNRRDRAALGANGDGIEDGILPPDGNKIPAGDTTTITRPTPCSRPAEATCSHYMRPSVVPIA